MSQRFAILLDGGFVTKKLYHKGEKRGCTCEEVLAFCDRIRKHPYLADRDLLRIYFYDAPPATDVLVNPVDKTALNLAKSDTFKWATKLHEELQQSDHVAFRAGVVNTRGWQVPHHAIKSIANEGRQLVASDLRPNIEQKGVDLRIGLDIARLSLCHFVDTIVAVTADSDMIPAFKFARREGVRVFLCHLNHPVKRELTIHTDGVIEANTAGATPQ